jgi:hypothetical protein
MSSFPLQRTGYGRLTDTVAVHAPRTWAEAWRQPIATRVEVDVDTGHRLRIG